VLYRLLQGELGQGPRAWRHVEGLDTQEVLELLASQELREVFVRLAKEMIGGPVFRGGTYTATVGVLWQEDGSHVLAEAQRGADQLRPLFEGVRRPAGQLVAVVRAGMPFLLPQ